MTNENRYEEFASHLKLEHGLADSTIKKYVAMLKAFKEWSETSTKSLPVPWSEITEHDIRAYISHLKPSPTYASLVLSTFSRFFIFMRDITRERLDDPSAKVTRPKKAKHHQNTLELWEVNKLMVYIFENSPEATKLRNWALVSFLFGTGLRISECCGLKVDKIRYADELPESVTVIGKGNKERTVFLNATAKEALYKWLKERQKLMMDLPPTSDRSSVWIVPNGKYAGQQLQPQTVRKMLRKFAPLAIDKHVHPHMFRHTFITEAVRARAPLHAIQAAAGHASIATTGNYMHANTDDIRQVSELVPDARESSSS